MLVDGAAYFEALRSSLLKAQRRIFIVGWDIDSRTPIRGTAAPDDGAPLTLGPLLTHLTERNKKLEVYLLLWDYSVLYALEREPVPRLNLDWRTPRRVKVCLDGELPMGASHHEKLVVIDDKVAYCGGLDLTIRRWDTPAHRPSHPDRVDPFDAPYPPFHDLQLVVDGDAAGALGRLVRHRWSLAHATNIPSGEVSGDAWPDAVRPDLERLTVGIARTRPAHNGQTELRQVQKSYLHAIAQAERLIYIENQYVTSIVIAEALNTRLHETPELELVALVPQTPGGWLESHTMGAGQHRFLSLLIDDEVAPRTRVLYPWSAEGGERASIKVHAKLMIVDDVFFQAGSSNLNSRSMGVDRECDLAFEAQSDEDRRRIAGLRRKLLAEHLGLDVDTLAELEAGAGSMVSLIDAHEGTERGLAPLEPSKLPAETWEPLVELADPEQPIDPAEYVGDLFGATQIDPNRYRLLKLGSIAVGIAATVAVWRYTPVADWVDPEQIAPLLDALSDSAWAGPLVLLFFVLGSLIVFPVTVLVAATAIALGPISGFTWAFIGSMLGAAATYGLGRLIGPRKLERLVGRWIKRVSKRLRRGGIVPVMLVRNVPIAPFSVVNVIAGATTMRFRDFLIGTALGMGPGIGVVTLLGDRLRELWEAPTASNFAWLGIAVALWIGVALGLQVLSNRMSADEDV